jgi:TRAP transporter TAXI family solute receptor
MERPEPHPHDRKRLRSFMRRRPGEPGLHFDIDRAALKDAMLIVVPALIIVIGAFWIASRFIRPAPPERFVMATGPEGGAYRLFAQRYRDILARDGITIDLRPSAGASENLQLLTDPDSKVQAALVQAGMTVGDGTVRLESLGSVYYEPLWIFYRGARELTLLNELVDKRIAVGAEGSGTRALALELLRAVGARVEEERFQPLGGAAAADALMQGAADAAFVVGAPDAPIVQRLLTAGGIRLLSLENAEAFTRRFTYLSVRTLPRGVLDLAAQIPAHDITLLATTATLVARKDFHPALALLLLNAASEVHSPSGVLQGHKEFPAARESTIPLSKQAERYLEGGPPFLQRYLPFWVANLIERMLVLLVPFFAILVPAFKILPSLWEWRSKARVFRWYGEVKYLEDDLIRDPDPAHAPQMLQRLDAIELGLSHTSIPNSYSDYAYNLRTHLDIVRGRILRLARSGERASEPVAQAPINDPPPPPHC